MPVIERRWKYAGPPWRYVVALTAELDQWLHPALIEGEPVPLVVEAVGNQRVVLAPWVDPAVARVEILVSPDEAGSGTVLTVRAHPAADDDDHDDDTRRRVRHRLGQLFGERLRHHVDG